MYADLKFDENSTNSSISGLGRLIGLHTTGVLTDDEFEAEKTQLLRVRPRVSGWSARGARDTVRIGAN